MADHNPTEHHKRAFKRGWRTALRVLHKERAAYVHPNYNTWMAIGYRHGLKVGRDDDYLVDRAFDWSLVELRQNDQVDVAEFS
jgi:hypothetical protein